MATGDILSAQIVAGDNTSWYVEVTIEGLSTGGTYDFGYSSSLLTTEAKFRVNATRETFDATGTATTVERVLYGLLEKYQYWDGTEGSNTTIDEEISGSNVIVRVALSDWVYSGDILTLDVDAGFYTEASASNAVTGLSITNNSTANYQPPIANWSIPLYGRTMGLNELTGERDESGVFEVRVKAYHRDGVDGQSVPCVKVTATGQTSAHVETIYLTTETIDQETYGDALPIGEFIGNIPTTNFTDGELVDIDFIAYPSVGDSTSTLSTADKALSYSWPTSQPITQTVLCDAGGTHGTQVVVVDSTNGDDTTGAVTDITSFDYQTPPSAFQTVQGALEGMYTANGRFGGIIYLQSGDDYDYTGASASSYPGADTQYTIIKPFPGLTKADVTFITASLNYASATDETFVMMNDVTLNIPTGQIVVFKGPEAVWFHDVDMQAAGTTTISSEPSMMFFTGSSISSINQGFRPRTTQETYCFMRGNTISVDSEEAVCHVYIGNSQTEGATVLREYVSSNTALTSMYGVIVADNRMSADDNQVQIQFGTDTNGDNTAGIAVVNNLCERISGTQYYVLIAGDATGAYTVNNVLVWNNTVVGQRCNMAYNDNSLNVDAGEDPVEAYEAPRYFWSIKGNIFDDFNSVTDNDGHGGVAGVGRTGNKSILHGVGLSSNCFCERTGAAGSYLPYFDGLNSVVGSSISPIDPLYTEDASATGTGVGGGDYHITESSPAYGIMFNQYLTYDLDGTERVLNGSAGVYEVVVLSTGIVVIRRRRSS